MKYYVPFCGLRWAIRDFDNSKMDISRLIFLGFIQWLYALFALIGIVILAVGVIS